ncbi:aminotransferase class I/II-fold pyridoxal phosphate-dependent enzyme [Carnobacterium jeotgali]|uniref:aminotransferase class I/II-fold pyridoxal phosphate-dependent enzyme n=1 Tax=Carnobacterium jeotgali TaxID=545534 RepID=UPI00388D40F3
MNRKKDDAKQLRRPLFDVLKQHEKKEKISFHVPGHKNGMNWDASLTSFHSMLSFDQTEVSGLDYLHEPVGVLKESQDLLGELYSSKKSYYLVNGSTVGNLAMIMGSTNKGDRVFVDRSCHQSVIHALELAELHPVFLTPELNEFDATPLGISLPRLEEAFKLYPSVKALIVTYPTYDGMVYSLKELIDYARKRKCLVLVDEAHGPHFTLGAPFPTSALDLGADVVVQSAHKMLPSLTQTAYLHLGHHVSFSIESQIEHYLHIFQSSSPSYPLMLSLEYARYFLAFFNEKDLETTLNYRDLWKKQFENAGLEIFQSDDPLKVRVSWAKHSGEVLATQLEEQGIFSEKTDESTVLLTFPLLKQEAEVSEPFSLHLLQEAESDWVDNGRKRLSMAPHMELDLSYNSQKNRMVKRTRLEEAQGEIAAQNITPYPPGIPLVLKGERLTNEQIRQVEYCLSQSMRVVGLENKTELFIFSEND